MRWQPAYVALGSNLSNPLGQVEKALRALAGVDGTRLVLTSSPWKSRPMGPQDQPDFVNAVAGLVTTCAPQTLLDALGAIERRLGKVEPAVRWGPRVIDLDLLVFGREQRDDPRLSLPHPGLHRRNFVLYPLAEIAADLWVPGLGRVRALRDRISADGLERLAAWGPGDG
jgi:2-amino-4-hydroxy-6-hydroxymethyldihydropteridine diphosphokinase